MDTLLQLQQWYTAQCDGDWEHQFGVHIDTLDNPGWLVKIDLAETALSDISFPEVAEGLGDGDHPKQSRWIHCSVRDGVWRGAGDETELDRLLTMFLDWAAKHA